MEAIKYIYSSENFTEENEDCEKLIKTHKSDFMSVMWCVFNRYFRPYVCRKHLENSCDNRISYFICLNASTSLE